MPANVQGNSPHMPSLPIYIRDNDNDEASPDNKETSPLTSKIKDVNNSKDKPSSPGNKNFTGKIFGTLNNLLPQRSVQKNVEMEDDGVAIPLAEVITGGEALRSQAESLLYPRDGQPVPRGWKGGMFQRFLVGAGILTGIGTLGGAGYKYYAGRSGPDERTENTTQNYSTEPSLNPVKLYNRSEAIPGEIFTTLQPGDSTKSKPRHSRRHLPPPVPGTTVSPELPAGVLDYGKMSKEELLVSVAEYLLVGKDSINKDRVILLARSIQSNYGLFGEVKGQWSVLARAESIVRQWFFYNTLGTQPEECLLDVIINKMQSHDYVVGQIPSFLRLTEYLTLDNLTQSQIMSLNNLWRVFLIKEIPLLKVLDSSVEGLKVRENDFFDLYVGTKALDGFQSYSVEEAMEIGHAINCISSGNSTLKKQIDLLKIPYLLSGNEFITDEYIDGGEKDSDALKKYIHDMNVVNEIKDYMENKYNEYSSSIALLTASDAMKNSSIKYPGSNDGSYIKSPNDWPDDYRRRVEIATDKFEKLDEILILAAFGELPKNEREYISSPEVSVHQMSIVMRALRKGGGLDIDYISLREDNVDLISVRLGEEERIYALKKRGADRPGYHFIRVDRDIHKYIENEILDYNIDDYCAVEDNKAICGDDTFSYAINVRGDPPLRDKEDSGTKVFINQLLFIHKMNMHLHFDPFAQSPVKRDEFSDVVKQKIPFYDYIQAGLESKSVHRAPSCRTPPGLPMTVELANIIASSGIVNISPVLTPDKLNPALSNAAKEELRNLVSEGFLNKRIMDIEQQITAVSGYLYDGENGITKDNESIILLAREIFDNSGLFKREFLEKISIVLAKSIICRWFFDTLMGTQPEDYILDIMSKERRPQGYTVGDISDVLNLFNFFIKDGFSEQQLTSVHSVWHTLLMEKLPLLKLEENSIKSMSLWNFRFSNLYAGTQFLEGHSFQEYTAEEAMKIGEILWDVADKERWIMGKNNLFRMPALIFIKSGNPKLNGRNKFDNFLAVNEYVNYRATIKEMERGVIKKYNDYLSSLKLWLDDVQSKKSESDDSSLTFNVIHKFQLLDKHLIFSAFGGLPVEEREFISSPQAKIYRADVNLEMYNHGNGMAKHIYNKKDEVDIISVWVNDVERIYAIKNKVNNRNVCQFIRLERDVQSYISNGILDTGSNDETIISDNDNIICNLAIVSEDLIGDSVNNNIETLADKFSLDHGVNIFYDFQYPIESSVDEDDNWISVKDLIPFSAFLNNNSTESIPSCFMNQAGLSSTIEFQSVIAPENISKSIRLVFSNKSKSVVPDITKIESKEEQLLAVADYLFDGKNGITENVEAIEKLAINILAKSDRYGGASGEGGTIAQAKLAIRRWFFYNMLGMFPDYYIFDKLYEGAISGNCSVGALPGLLSIDKVFRTDGIPEAQLSALRTVWACLLQEEMPFLKFNDKVVTKLDIRSNDFANLYTGMRYLEANSVQDYTPDEAINVGGAMWDVAVTEGISLNEASLFKIPIHYYVNSIPFRSIYRNEILDLFSINQYMKYRQGIKEQYEKTLAAADSWLSKGELADKIISKCPVTRKIYVTLPNYNHGIEVSGKNKEYFLKEDYLGGSDKPCPTAPDSLSEEYQKQTENFSDSLKELDKKLLINALNKLPKKERDFINSPAAIISPIKLKGFDPKSRSFEIYKEIKTELVSVTLNKEERIYALKRSNADNPDDFFIRVDFNISKYHSNKIIDSHPYAHFVWSRAGEEKILSSGDVFENIAEALSEKNRLKIYKSLYELGNDKSDAQAIWSNIKDFIPFYTCIESSINHNLEQAIPACVIDGVSLIPVIGQTARLGTKAAKAGIIGFNAAKMGAKTGKVINLAAAGLPTKTEVTALGKSMIGALDPGFELVARGSKALTKNILNVMRSDKKMTSVVAKITAVEGGYKQTVVVPEKTITATLPGTEILVPVVPIGETSELRIYVRFDEETGERFGRKYFITESNRLEPVPVSLAERIKKIQSEGMGGKGSKSAPSQWEPQKNQISKGGNKAPEELTSGEKGALYAYGGSYHSTVNGFMMEGMPKQYGTEYYRQEIFESVRDIKSALKKIPPYKGCVYRGGHISSRNFDRLKKGSLVSSYGFLSTSIDLNEAKKFRRKYLTNQVTMVYSIKLKKRGHPISLYTAKPNEQEVLIESGCFFRVVDFNHKSVLMEEIDMPSLDQVDVDSLSKAEKDSIIYIDDYRNTISEAHH